MARKYINPGRREPDFTAGTRRSDLDAEDQDELARLAARLLAAGRGPRSGGYARHIRFEGGQPRILAALRGMPLPAADGPPPPGAKLDSEPFSRNLLAYLKAVRDDESARRKIANAWTEEVPAEGGFLLSESLRSGITAYLTASTVYPRAMVLPMTAYRMGLPELDNPSQAGGAQALGGIQWSIVGDGEAIPATAGSFGASALTARKLAALLAGVPDELLDDASDAMSDLLGRVIGEGYAWVVDDYAINGTGAGEPQGLLYAGCAYGVTRNTSGEVLHQDVVGMLAKLHPRSKAGACWLMSDDTFESLLTLYETIGTAPSGQQIAPPGTLKFNTVTGTWELCGVPAFPGDHQPQLGTAGDLVLADLSWLAIGERQAMTVDLSSQGRGFPSGTTDIRIRGRLDMRYLIPSVITLSNGVQRSPVVVLD